MHSYPNGKVKLAFKNTSCIHRCIYNIKKIHHAFIDAFRTLKKIYHAFINVFRTLKNIHHAFINAFKTLKNTSCIQSKGKS